MSCVNVASARGPTSQTTTALASSPFEVCRLFRDEASDIELRLSDARNQVFLRCGVTELASRLLEGQYPQYQQVIPTKATTVVRLSR